MKIALPALVYATLLFPLGANAQRPSPVKTPHLVLGTQTIGAAYGFTNESRLVETARGILNMGSDILKFSLLTKTEEGVTPKNLTEVARFNPSVKTVLAMPFSHIQMWTYPVQQNAEDVTDPHNLDANYRELYDLTRYLLTTYKNTGKTFYLGNWEGDWHLLRTNPDYVPTETEVKAMTDWVNMRQKAVDDAKHDTPHTGVETYFYLEINRVQDAIAGKARLTNKVLPATNPDFVSYSSYDSLDDIEKQLPTALDYIQSQLKPKTGLSRKRVWIGEYGFPALRYLPQQQESQSRRVACVALDWGCPFALYWEFYNNEVEDGKQRGFWMVNDKNEQQPVYHTHQQFFQKSRAYIVDFKRQRGRAPSQQEFNQQAKARLADDGL